MQKCFPPSGCDHSCKTASQRTILCQICGEKIPIQDIHAHLGSETHKDAATLPTERQMNIIKKSTSELRRQYAINSELCREFQKNVMPNELTNATTNTVQIRANTPDEVVNFLMEKLRQMELKK